MTYLLATYLIKWIPIRQKERWARLKRWHNIPNLPLNLRHMFMQREIDLIRREKNRFLEAKNILQ